MGFKSLLIAGVILTALFPSTVSARENFKCFMPDAICHPPSEKGWNTEYYPTENVVMVTEEETLTKGAYIKPKISVRRQTLNRSAQRNVSRYVQKSLTGKYSGARIVPSVKGGDLSAVYLYLDHYLPVEGMLITRSEGDLMYSVECERQRTEANAESDLIEWCAGFADDIVWPQEREFLPDPGGQVGRWSKLRFDSHGIIEEYERISAREEPNSLNEALISDYIGLMITESLYARSNRANQDLTADLNMAVRRLGMRGSQQVKALAAIHEDYLAGESARMERSIGNYIRAYSDVPYWMMSKWMESVDDAAARSFAERAIIGYPSEISRYTYASYLSRRGEYAKSDEVLKGTKTKNVNVTVLMAQNAMGEGRMKDAERLMTKASRIAPDDIELLFTKAEYYNRQKNDGYYKKAGAIYARLENLPNLSNADRLRLYRNMAGMEFDPDRKIEYYQKMLALKPDGIGVYYDLGKLYLMEKRDIGAALRNFKKYLRSAPRRDPKVKELRALVWKLEAGG